MKLNLVYGLPFAEAFFIHQDIKKHLPRVLIDTGAAATLLSVEVAIELGLGPKMTDTLRSMRGIGGIEFVYEKRIDKIQLGDAELLDCQIQVGAMDYGIDMDANIGTDFLTAGEIVINMGKLEINKDTV